MYEALNDHCEVQQQLRFVRGHWIMTINWSSDIKLSGINGKLNNFSCTEVVGVFHWNFIGGNQRLVSRSN